MLFLAHCDPCYTKKITEEREQMMQYKDATIFIKRMESKCDQFNDNQGKGSIYDDDEEDTSFTQVNLVFKF